MRSVFGHLFSGLGVGALSIVLAACSTDAQIEQEPSAQQTVQLSKWSKGSPKHVVDWDLQPFSLPPPHQFRGLVMVHTAQFDAINSIARRYQPAKFQVEADPGASQEAAAIQAAYRVLYNVFPPNRPAYDAARANSLATIPDGPAKDAGIAVGDQIGAMTAASRNGDGWLAPNPIYTPQQGPEYYQLTNGVNPVFQLAASFRPFALTSHDQFKLPPPRGLNDPNWTRDFNEIKAVGGVCADASNCPRTQAQFDNARFYVEQGHVMLFRLARNIATSESMSLYDAARFFSHLSLAMHDGLVTCFSGKYENNFVRPVTAIRNADNDGNPDTAADPNWRPSLEVLGPPGFTPPHPEYPAGHGTIMSSMVPVFEAYFGQTYSVDVTSSTAPGITLHLNRWSDLEANAVEARVYGGYHFRTTMELSQTQGHQVGKWVLDTTLARAE